MPAPHSLQRLRQQQRRRQATLHTVQPAPFIPRIALATSMKVCLSYLSSSSSSSSSAPPPQRHLPRCLSLSLFLSLLVLIPRHTLSRYAPSRPKHLSNQSCSSCPLLQRLTIRFLAHNPQSFHRRLNHHDLLPRLSLYALFHLTLHRTALARISAHGDRDERCASRHDAIARTYNNIDHRRRCRRAPACALTSARTTTAVPYSIAAAAPAHSRNHESVHTASTFYGIDLPGGMAGLRVLGGTVRGTHFHWVVAEDDLESKGAFMTLSSASAVSTSSHPSTSFGPPCGCFLRHASPSYSGSHATSTTSHPLTPLARSP